MSLPEMIDILNAVKLIISKEINLPIEHLTPDTKIGDLDADSLSIIQIIFALEERYGINIPLRADEASRLASREDNADSENLALMTIADIVQTVQERVDAKA
jgi:acyl carrier protein